MLFFGRRLRRCVVGVPLIAGLWLLGSARAAAADAVRMFGADYVDVRDFAQRYGFASSWVKAGEKMRLKSRWTEIEFTVHRPEVWMNDVCLYLTQPVVAARGSLYLGARDAELIIGPILAPRRNPPLRPVKTIVIDPGHGGNDPGKQNTRLKLNEKALTLDVAKRLEQLLKRDGFKVIMTRRTDRSVGLDDRVSIASRARADVFVSLHFNSFTDPSVAGAETFVMTPLAGRSAPAAEKDRRMPSTRFPGNAHDPWNSVLGYHVHRNIVDQMKAPDRGLKRFRYHVLRTVNCPAVLVEAGFLSNTTEARNAGSAKYRQQLASALFTGIKNYANAVAGARVASRSTNSSGG